MKCGKAETVDRSLIEMVLMASESRFPFIMRSTQNGGLETPKLIPQGLLFFFL